MRGSTPGYSHTGKTAIVADTGAFITGAVRSVYYPVYTAESVVGEVRDSKSRRILEELLAMGRLHIVNPSSRYITISRSIAVQGLSSTDLEILALALELRDKGYNVIVATDDYALQESALRSSLRIMRIRYRGARRGSYR